MTALQVKLNGVSIWFLIVICPSFAVDKSQPGEINKGSWCFFSFLNWTFFRLNMKRFLKHKSTVILTLLTLVTKWIWKKSEQQGLASLEWSLTFVSFVNMFTKDQHLSHIIHVCQNKDWLSNNSIWGLASRYKDLTWTSCKYQELGIGWFSEPAEPQSSHVQLACGSNSL